MFRRPQFDLGDTPEQTAFHPRQPADSAWPRPGARTLMARLLCLKALYDLDRNPRSGEGGSTLGPWTIAEQPRRLHS